MFLRLLILCALAASACAGLGHPDSLDAERARARWPGSTVASLEEGRQLYAAHCSGCHALHLPDELPPAQWPGVLDDMQRKSGLHPSERDLVERFLVVMSARTR